MSLKDIYETSKQNDGESEMSPEQLNAVKYRAFNRPAQWGLIEKIVAAWLAYRAIGIIIGLVAMIVMAFNFNSQKTEFDKNFSANEAKFKQMYKSNQ